MYHINYWIYGKVCLKEEQKYFGKDLNNQSIAPQIRWIINNLPFHLPIRAGIDHYRCDDNDNTNYLVVLTTTEQSF